MAYEILDTVQYGPFVSASTAVGRYLFGVVSAGEITLPSAGGRVTGVVCLDDGKEGQATKLQVGGVARVQCTGVIAEGDILQALADGTVDQAASGDYPVGVALEAGADGQIISVDLVRSLVPLA